MGFCTLIDVFSKVLLIKETLIAALGWDSARKIGVFIFSELILTKRL